MVLTDRGLHRGSKYPVIASVLKGSIRLYRGIWGRERERHIHIYIYSVIYAGKWGLGCRVRIHNHNHSVFGFQVKNL